MKNKFKVGEIVEIKYGDLRDFGSKTSAFSYVENPKYLGKSKEDTYWFDLRPDLAGLLGEVVSGGNIGLYRIKVNGSLHYFSRRELKKIRNEQS